jgi:DNA-binding CsgD family transcriptional regulator
MSGESMANNEEIELLKQISSDLRELKRHLRFLSRDSITTMLNKVATTAERQEMWRLADGTRGNEEIAKQIGVSLRSVQYFVQEAENVGLITSERRGYPKRVEEIIPKEWKPWKQGREKTKDQTSFEKSVSMEGV